MTYPFMLDHLARSGLAADDVAAVAEPSSDFGKGPVGFRLPYWYPDGTPHPAMYRVRYDPNVIDINVKGKYDQPSKEALKKLGHPETDATYPYLNPKILGGATWNDVVRVAKRILIVEGELKAASAGKYLLMPAIGIGGCANATYSDAKTGEHELHPVLKQLLRPGVHVEIALDGDIFTNPNVNRSAGTLRRVLVREGIVCSFVLLPGAR